MNPKNKAVSVWGTLSVLTMLLYFFCGMEPYPRRALPLIWAFFSWNFFAYGFNRDMWPWVWIELKGGASGKPSEREFMFWGSAAMYLALLATIAFAN